MKVKVNYFGHFRQITGKETDARDCSEETGLCDLLAEMAADYGSRFRKVVFSGAGQLGPSVVILVNGNVVDKRSPPVLSDGDQVSLLTAVGGG